MRSIFNLFTAGGKKVVLKVAGKDATKEFNNFHNAADVINKYGPKLYVGDIGSGSAAPQQAPKKESVPNDAGMFGELIPYGDPNWYQGWNSTYYNESHHKFRYDP